MTSGNGASFLHARVISNLSHTHLGSIVSRKTCIWGSPVLCLEKGIVFATGHRKERSDAC